MTDAVWTRSSRCESNACVEVAFVEDKVLVRNSNARSLVVRISHDEWRAFLAGVRRGEFRVPKP